MKKPDSKQENLVLLLIVIPFVSGAIMWGIVMALLGVIWPDAPIGIQSIASFAGFMLGMVIGALIERRFLSRKSDE